MWNKYKLKIEYLKLNQLTPDENNARRHEAADVKTVENSIEKFGMCDPIGIWGENNLIVEGHGRLLALTQLGYDEAPCIRLDHLTDEERRAYALAHNKTAEMSTWDFDLLEKGLSELELDFDMSEFGFDEFKNFDHISELLEDDDAMSIAAAQDKDTFNITFTFPIEKRQMIEGYMKEITKEVLTAKIIELIEGEQ